MARKRPCPRAAFVALRVRVLSHGSCNMLCFSDWRVARSPQRMISCIAWRPAEALVSQSMLVNSETRRLARTLSSSTVLPWYMVHSVLKSLKPQIGLPATLFRNASSRLCTDAFPPRSSQFCGSNVRRAVMYMSCNVTRKSALVNKFVSLLNLAAASVQPGGALERRFRNAPWTSETSCAVRRKAMASLVSEMG